MQDSNLMSSKQPQPAPVLLRQPFISASAQRRFCHHARKWFAAGRTSLVRLSHGSPLRAKLTFGAGRDHGAYRVRRKPGSARGYGWLTRWSTQSVQPCRETGRRMPKRSTDGTARCRGRRRCYPRTNTQSSIARKRDTGRGYTVSARLDLTRAFKGRYANVGLRCHRAAEMD
jgi:hypothetical protein